MRVAVLGGGQLARMMALEGIPLGCRFRFLEPAADPPAAVAGEVVRSPYDDPAGLARLANGCDVATFEFENVPAASAAFLRSRLPVLPPPAALEASQDRVVEKRLFRELGIRTAPFHPVDAQGDLKAALEITGLPVVIKTRRLGYDGKGQAIAESAREAAGAVAKLGPAGLIAEGFVRFRRELSIVVAAGRDGSRVFYPLTENHHRDGILRASYAPAPGLAPAAQAEAEALAGRLLDRLEYVGVLAVELFQTDQGLLASEMAPRVHNSGHWTLDGAAASQFENHVRAVAGLPLSDPHPAAAASAMVNVIGQAPATETLARVPGARLHMYGKSPRPGRKLGHVNAVGPDWATVMATARRVWDLMPGAGPLPLAGDEPIRLA